MNFVADMFINNQAYCCCKISVSYCLSVPVSGVEKSCLCSVLCVCSFLLFLLGARGLDEMGWKSMDLGQALWQLPTFIHFVVGWHWAAQNSIWAVAKMKSYWKWTLLMFCMLEMCYLGHEKFQWEEKHWLQTTRVSCQTDHLHAVLWLFL